MSIAGLHCLRSAELAFSKPEPETLVPSYAPLFLLSCLQERQQGRASCSAPLRLGHRLSAANSLISFCYATPRNGVMCVAVPPAVERLGTLSLVISRPLLVTCLLRRSRAAQSWVELLSRAAQKVGKNNSKAMESLIALDRLTSCEYCSARRKSCRDARRSSPH